MIVDVVWKLILRERSVNSVKQVSMPRRMNNVRNVLSINTRLAWEPVNA